jgi:hypothetical protein
MKTIQFILFMVFISGASILMINSGRVSPQVEQQHNSYWTIIANAQSTPVSTFGSTEPDHFTLPVDNETTRSSGYYPGNGRGGHVNRNHSAGNKVFVQENSINPIHIRIIQSTLQPMDLLISPEEAANYTASLETKTQ